MLMPVLPYDVIYEILVWLPVKSLLRFRCVCKSWYEIIDRRDFIYSHVHTSSINNLHRKLILPCPVPRYGGLPYPGYLKLYRALDINNGFQEELLHNFKIPDCLELKHTANCNGLVLFHLRGFKFSVWNPSIRRYRILPYPSGIFHGQKYSFGFGYDPTINDYKVVLIISAKPYYQGWNVWILELKSRIEDLSCIEFHDIEETIDGNCFVDGCLHFLCFGSYWKIYTIVSFDLVKETFSIVPHPTYQGQEYARSLRAFEGCLSIYFCTVKNTMDFFVRKKEGDEFTWTKLFSIPRDLLKDSLRTLGYSKEGEDKILLMTGRQMYSYDIKEAHIQPIEMTTYHGPSQSIFYTESLVSVYEKRTMDEFDEEKKSLHKFEEWKREIAKYKKANERGSSKKSKKKKKKKKSTKNGFITRKEP